MEHDFWAERYSNNQIGFHLPGPNPHLVAHAATWLKAPSRVLVPLCGKSHDLHWLREQGHDVVGVEFVEAAAIAFFEEHGLEPAVSRIGPHPSLRAPGISIILDDFFALTPASAGRFPAIYDRAALIAIEPAKRPAYLKRLRELGTDDVSLLLVGFDHDLGTGPPFSLSAAELGALMVGQWAFWQLADVDVLATEPRFRARGATRVREQIWLAQPLPGR
ncbi:MAG TPA: thiopurine S-methyltransferase [Polyangia bacterium]